MDAHEVMEKLNYIVRHPHVAADAVDDLFDEWLRQNERISELEAKVDRLQWLYPADGELPPDECDILFLVDDTVDLGCYADSKFWNGDERGICPERVTRWRYVN